MSLSFRELKEANRERQHDYPDCSDWSLNDWAVALMGEAGELCNILKKVRRGDYTLSEAMHMIQEEIGDVAIYLDLLSQAATIDLETAVTEKFNRRSEEIGSTTYLGQAERPLTAQEKQEVETLVVEHYRDRVNKARPTDRKPEEIQQRLREFHGLNAAETSGVIRSVEEKLKSGPMGWPL